MSSNLTASSDIFLHLKIENKNTSCCLATTGNAVNKGSMSDRILIL